MDLECIIYYEENRVVSYLRYILSVHEEYNFAMTLTQRNSVFPQPRFCVYDIIVRSPQCELIYPGTNPHVPNLWIFVSQVKKGKLITHLVLQRGDCIIDKILYQKQFSIGMPRTVVIDHPDERGH